MSAPCARSLSSEGREKGEGGGGSAMRTGIHDILGITDLATEV